MFFPFLLVKGKSEVIPESGLKDSLFCALEIIKADSLRFDEAVKFFNINKNKSFSRDLIDYAIEIAKTSNMPMHECIAYNAIARSIMEKDGVNDDFHFWVKKIKDVSFHINNYAIYLTLREAEIYWYIDMGKYELSLDKIRELSCEAEELDSERGRIICKLLLSTLYYIKQQDDKLIEINKEILNIPGLYFRERLLASLQLVSTYLAMNEYDETLKYLDLSTEILNKHVSEYNNFESHRSNYLTIEMFYCNIYRLIPDTSKLKIHIEKAKNLMTPDEGYINKSKYHHNLASYYHLTGNWEKSIFNFDKAIEYRMNNATNPILINKLNIEKASAIRSKGDLKTAATIMLNSVMSSDSIYNSILENQKEMINQNFRMEKAMLRAENIKKTFGISIIIVVFIIVSILLLFTLRLFIINKKLKRSEHEISDAYEIIRKADKQKEIFVNNLSSEIKEPLNYVIELAALISDECYDLSREEIIIHTQSVKRNSDKILFLVNSILDLSRLESGVSKLSLEKIDLKSFMDVMLNQDFCSKEHSLNINFDIKGKDFMCVADPTRLEKLLDSYIYAEEIYGKNKDIDVTLSKSDNDSIIIDIKGTSLADGRLYNIETNIQRNINMIVLSKLGWKAEINNYDIISIIIPS